MRRGTLEVSTTMRILSTMATLMFAGLVAACSSGAAAPTGASGTQPAASTPPLAQPTGDAGSLPPFSFAIPSFAPDTALEAAFPTEIDGEPVTGLTSASFLAALQGMGRDQEDITAFVSGMQGIGVDPAAVGFGGATATVNGEDVSIQGLRAPGGSAASVIDVFIALDPPDPAPTLTMETIGGKTVTVATLEDGAEEFYYASGELAWFLPGADRSQAEIIFAALP